MNEQQAADAPARRRITANDLAQLRRSVGIYRQRHDWVAMRHALATLRELERARLAQRSARQP